MAAIHREVYAACPHERIYTLLADLEAVHRYKPRVHCGALEGPHPERRAPVLRPERSQ
jgi:hypothetical protein